MTTTGDIDVTIPGSEPSVDSAAKWLEGLRDDAYFTSFLLDQNTLANGIGGEIAAAVSDYATPLRDATKNLYDRALKAADVMRSFADQLSSHKTDMNEHLETAISDGLEVKGNIIKYPTKVSPPGTFPRKGTQEARQSWYAADEAYDNYQAKIRDFEKVKGRVEATFKDLNDWIVNNLVTTKKDVLIAPYSGRIKSLLENLTSGGSNLSNNVFSDTASDLRDAATDWATNRAAEKSKNPAVATKSTPPSQKAIDAKLNKPKPTAWRNTAESLETLGSAAKYLGKAVTIGGPIADLAMGNSVGKVLVTTAAGVATVMLLPEAVTVTGVVLVSVAAVAVAEGAGWLYENMIPLQYREMIDHPWEEAKKSAGKALDTTQNWAADTAEKAKDKISDTWNQATGWSWDYFGV